MHIFINVIFTPSSQYHKLAKELPMALSINQWLKTFSLNFVMSNFASSHVRHYVNDQKEHNAKYSTDFIRTKLIK